MPNSTTARTPAPPRHHASHTTSAVASSAPPEGACGQGEVLVQVVQCQPERAPPAAPTLDAADRPRVKGLASGLFSAVLHLSAPDCPKAQPTSKAIKAQGGGIPEGSRAELRPVGLGPARPSAGRAQPAAAGPVVNPVPASTGRLHQRGADGRRSGAGSGASEVGSAPMAELAALMPRPSVQGRPTPRCRRGRRGYLQGQPGAGHQHAMVSPGSSSKADPPPRPRPKRLRHVAGTADLALRLAAHPLIHPGRRPRPAFQRARRDHQLTQVGRARHFAASQRWRNCSKARPATRSMGWRPARA